MMCFFRLSPVISYAHIHTNLTIIHRILPFIYVTQLADDSCDVGVSPTWTIAGWDYTIVQIAPDSEFKTPYVADDERQLVKILRGSLIDVNLNGIFGKLYLS